MSRNVKLQFSGHETFPLRYRWFKQVFDAVRAQESQGLDTPNVFSVDDTIGILGVGKNVVGP